MIEVKKVTTRKELLHFIKFPFKLFKDSKYWVPPLIREEMKYFDVRLNPMYKNVEAHCFLAYDGHEVVGRVAAIINWIEVKDLSRRKIRFGWFDVINDISVTKVLLDQVIELGKKHNLNHIEGPMGFSNLGKVGVLTEGFEEMGTIASWYSKPYYKTHLETLQFQIEKTYLESKLPIASIDISYYNRIKNFVEKRYELRTLSFSSYKEILPYLNEMFDLLNTSYKALASFVPITAEQKLFIKEKYIPFVDPDFIKFVVDSEGKLVAFSIVMPSLAKAFQKAKGKMYPIGFLSLLYAKRYSKNVLAYLIGVAPNYQKKGVPALIFSSYYDTFKKRNIEYLIRTPELESNVATKQIWESFDQIMYKKRSTYKKLL